ncbi:MAG: BCD family MFS transporter [Chloroflexota bacterium]
MLIKRIRLGLIHIAVAMTLVPINSTLNRVMIKELMISATLVAILASLPYLLSPLQVAIGSFSDNHPLGGLKRTPYIIIGLLLCVFGVMFTPNSAFLLVDNPRSGLLMGILTFGAWGLGYNFATVAYLSLASEISGEKERGRTIAIMWFMMITSIIITAIVLSRLVDPYTPEALLRAFRIVGFTALFLGIFSTWGLEKHSTLSPETDKQHSWRTYALTVLSNPQAKLFFGYMIILLVAIFGQDLLLEPYAGEAFGMTVKATTRITAIWGSCVLVALLIGGWLERQVDKRKVAKWGALIALFGFLCIAFGGILTNTIVFYLGVTALGFGTGLSTVSNLSLMLDMTIPSNVGLYIGAWGMASALARLIGSVLGGVVRDVLTQITNKPVVAFIVVFSLEAALLGVSLILLHNLDVKQFRLQSRTEKIIEHIASVDL